MKHQLLIPALLLLAGTSHANVEVSTFDTGPEGWLVTDILAAPGSGDPSGWDATGQRLQTADVASWVTFSAPAQYLGDLSPYYGGVFGFELQDVAKDANADIYATFGIASGSTALFWFGGSPSTTAMTPFMAGLWAADTRWRLGGSPGDYASGTAPTEAQFQAVLANVTALRINADWLSGPDTSYLDNVLLLSPVPEPAAWALMAGGLAILATRRRRA